MLLLCSVVAVILSANGVVPELACLLTVLTAIACNFGMSRISDVQTRQEISRPGHTGIDFRPARPRTHPGCFMSQLLQLKGLVD